jgi:hypothetical protein
MTGPDTSDDARLHRAFDHLISLRARDVVDVDDVMAWVDRCTTKERVAWAQRLFATPIRQRVQARMRLSETPLGAFLPTESAERIAAIVARPEPVPERLVDDVVRSEKIRDEVRSTLSETLTGFVKKGLGDRDGEGVKGPGAGLRSAIGLGARAIAGAGKGLLGNIGEEVQQQLQGRVRDFVDGSVGAVQERIAKKLRSPETAEALGRHRRALFEDLLTRKEREAAEVKVPWDDLEALVPAIVEHALRRPEIRDTIAAEVRRGVDVLSEKTLREVLDELDLRDEARASFLIIMRPIAVAGGL